MLKRKWEKAVWCWFGVEVQRVSSSSFIPRLLNAKFTVGSFFILCVKFIISMNNSNNNGNNGEM